MDMENENLHLKDGEFIFNTDSLKEYDDITFNFLLTVNQTEKYEPVCPLNFINIKGTV